MFDIIITVIIVAFFGGIGLWAMGMLAWLGYRKNQEDRAKTNVKIARINEEIARIKAGNANVNR